MTLEACTVITRDRVAHARVLTRSFLEHNPGARLTALLLDDPDETVVGEPFDVVRPDALALEQTEFARMESEYDGLELSCAMKPWAIGHLLDHGAEVVLYLDSDVRVFDSLAPARDLALAHSLVLTPHWDEPPPAGRTEGDAARLVGGAFNGGFVAVSADAGAFLEWWGERLLHYCRNALDEGLFVDQRWLDLAPGYFPHHVLRDPGYNVAPWNTVTRTVARDGDRYVVNEAPLRFFHLSGFDPEAPYLLSRWLLPSPHTLLSENPALVEICARYAEELLAAGYLETARARRQ